MNQESQPETSSSQPVALMGAYERDNFGDILFLERTRRYLEREGITSIALSPFRATPELLTGDAAPTLRDVIKVQPLRALWTVGGEVGAVPLYAAYRMLDATDQEPNYLTSPRRLRRKIIRDASGGEVTDLAYLPHPSRFPELDSAPFVVNSAGVSGVDLLKGDIRVRAEAALADADFISVRERASSNLLSKMGLAHRLAPDLVHTLRFDRSDLAAPDARREATARRLALVQMSEAALTRVGVEVLAQSIARSDALRGYEIRLFTAGLAPHHDSPTLYAELRDRVIELSPASKITLSTATSALEKVEELAGSSIVIGTSLHAMIVATSFDVPHVGLLLAKVSNYAQAWDDPMPTAVHPDELDEAVTRAFALRASAHRGALADELATLADANMRMAIATVVNDSETARRARGAARMRQRAEVDRDVRRVATRSAALVRSALRPLS